MAKDQIYLNFFDSIEIVRRNLRGEASVHLLRIPRKYLELSFVIRTFVSQYRNVLPVKVHLAVLNWECE